MSAYFESGFCVRTPSWHRGENLLSDYPKDVDDARAKAGLLWEPEERETYQRLWVPVDERNSEDIFTNHVHEDAVSGVIKHEILRAVKNHKLIVRNDSENVLGV